MKIHSSLTGMAISAVMIALPFTTFAATKVSRQFAYDFTYFPQTTGAVVFSDGKFYQSSDPTVGNWSSMKMNAKTVDGFSGTTAVTLRHHTYAIGGANDISELEMSPGQIWSMKTSHPNALKKVKESSSLFRDLVKYKGALYASDSDANMWRSTNGTDWHEMNTSGLPNSSGFTKLVAGADTLYGIDDVAIYTSKNAKTWKKLTGDYQNHAYTGGVSVVEFQGKTYVAAYSLADQTADVWKVKNDSKFDRIFHENNTNNTIYKLFSGTSSLYLTGNDGSIRTLSGDAFIKSDTVTGQVQDVISTSGQDLFVVNHLGNVSLWK